MVGGTEAKERGLVLLERAAASNEAEVMEGAAPAICT